MSDGILSQEEINALLNGELNKTVEKNDANTTHTNTVINDFERDALGEVGNISMGTSATTLSTLLRRKVSITTPNVSTTNRERLSTDYPLPYLVIEVKYTEGLSGSNILVIKEEDACIISDLMMGGDGNCENCTLDEIRLSAVSEAMNQMMGSATTSLSSMFDRKIDIAPPELTLVDLGKENLDFSTFYDELVQIKFKMEIENLVNSEIMQIIPLEAVKSIISNLMGNTVEESSIDAITQHISPFEVVQNQVPVYQQPPQPQHGYNEQPIQYSEPSYQNIPQSQPVWDQQYQDIPSSVKKGEQIAVQPVQFMPLRDTVSEQLPQNIGLIMDVPLDVTVELGRARKTIKEILELSPGSIIQLDKLAGEPVDLMVNGKLIAKGEVVVIDESYGIRITTIISPIDRMNKLQ